MLVRKSCYASSARCAAKESYLKQVGFVNVFKRYCFFANGSSERFKSNVSPSDDGVRFRRHR